jgi:hypothetical protein
MSLNQYRPSIHENTSRYIPTAISKPQINPSIRRRYRDKRFSADAGTVHTESGVGWLFITFISEGVVAMEAVMQ